MSSDQISLLYQVETDWLNDVADSCEKRINRAQFSEGISWLYEEMLGIKKPKIVYYNSWESGYWRILFLKLFKKINIGSLGVSLHNRIEEVLTYAIWTRVENTLRSTVSRRVWKHVETIAYSINDAFWNSVAFPLGIALKNSYPWSSFDEYSKSLDWSNLIRTSIYDYFERIGVFEDSCFRKYMQLIQSGVFKAYCYEKLVVAIEPPEHIAKNASGELHSTTGAAVKFRGDWDYYFFNGLYVPEWIIKKPQKSTRKKFAKLVPQYQAVIYELLGHVRMMTLLGAKEITRKKRKTTRPVASNLKVSKTGELISGAVVYSDYVEEFILYKSEYKDPEIGHYAWVGVLCPSTGKRYFVPVDPATTDPLEGIAGAFGLRAGEYFLGQSA